MTERRIELVPLGKLKGAKKNPKQHSDDIEKSFGRFGFTEPVLLDERTGRLVAGHGRVEYLRKLQKDKAPAPDGIRKSRGQWLVPVVRGWASKNDAEAAAYLVASNKLSEAGGWDEQALATLLHDVEAVSNLDGIGLSPRDIARLLKDADGGVGEDESDQIVERFEIVVECKDERSQVSLLKRLTKEGYSCRSLIS